MAVYQCAHFFNNLHLVHGRAVRKIEKYLACASTFVDLPDGNQWLTKRSVVYRTDIEKSIKCFIYENLAGGLDQEDSDNAYNVMSHMGYVITYARCTVLWCSKLQT